MIDDMLTVRWTSASVQVDLTRLSGFRLDDLRGRRHIDMRWLLAFMTTVLFTVGVSACGDAGKSGDSVSSAPSSAAAAATDDPAARTPGTKNAPVPIKPETGPTRKYLNDGDHDVLGDDDGDNSSDVDRDASLDYQADENKRYHDNDDVSDLSHGHVATAADVRAVTPVVQRYYAIARAGNGAAACSQLIPSLAKAVPLDYGRFGAAYLHAGKTCPAVMDLLFKHFRRQLVAPVHVTEVLVKEDRAIALLGSRTMPASATSLERQNGAWIITQILGHSLP
jgi:hypothetical protein